MKNLTVVMTTMILVTLGLVVCAVAGVKTDGVFINLHIKKNGKSVAAAMVDVAYDDETQERMLMQYLKPDTEFSTVGNIFDVNPVLVAPKEGVTQTLKGNVSIELTLATEKKAEDVLQLDELTLCFVGSLLYADKYNVTKWTLSKAEFERVDKMWKLKKAEQKR
ncbi:MAG: hypothetical protein ACPIA7_08245 [Akkermansiaceae bacterium]